MKKLIVMMLGLFIAVSCEKYPDSGELNPDYLVTTDYKSDANFQSYSTFYISDSIRLVSDLTSDTVWKDADAKALVDQIVADMTARGYTRTNNLATASLGFQVTAVRDLYVVYGADPYWWWYYPYWDWGWYPYYPYYPYPYYISYSYVTGALMIELADLQNKDALGKVPMVWNVFTTGLLYSNTQYNMQLVEQAIDQAFTQSPYLKKN